MTHELIKFMRVLVVCGTALYISNKVCRTWIVCTALEAGAIKQKIGK